MFDTVLNTPLPYETLEAMGLNTKNVSLKKVDEFLEFSTVLFAYLRPVFLSYRY